jgi:hypothetical protein
MKIILNHLPKCAGNAFAIQFRTLFGNDAVCEVRPGLERREQRKLSAERYADYMMIYGHLSMRDENLLGAHRFRFTVLRDPVKRVLSSYHFFITQKALNPSNYKDGPDPSLEEFVASNVPAQLKVNLNTQARQLLGWLEREPVSVEEAAQIVAEKALLLKRFAVIGIYEEFRSTLNMLSWRLNLPRLRSVYANKTATDWRSKPVPSSIIEIIKARNTLDQALYDHCRLAFERERVRMEEEFLARSYFQQHASLRGSFEVDLGGPVEGSGWFDPEHKKDAEPFRWMSVDEGACVYLPLHGSLEGDVAIHAVRVNPRLDLNSIIVTVDGVPVSFAVNDASVGYLISFRMPERPARRGRVVAITVPSWHPSMAPDGRAHSIGVSRISVTAIEPQVQRDDALTVDAAV